MKFQLNKVCVSYGKKEVVRSVSLDVSAGETVALLGANGAGKSSILKACAGLIVPDSGIALLDGRDITRWSISNRARAGIGYLMQNGPVFSSLSVRENLVLSVQTLPVRERPDAMEFGLSHFPSVRARLDRRAGLLSGGERQLLAMAMLLARRPSLLLLDEPSAGLAPERLEELLTALRDLGRHTGTATLLVEQRTREALQVADRAVLLADGQVKSVTEQPRDWLDLDLFERVQSGCIIAPILAAGPPETASLAVCGRWTAARPSH